MMDVYDLETLLGTLLFNLILRVYELYDSALDVY